MLLQRDGTSLSRESVRTGITLLLRCLTATELQRHRVTAGVDQPDPDRVDRAAQLLTALEITGEALGVDPETWRNVTSLPAACWDVVRYPTACQARHDQS